jgi:catechol 2,3-dioxygenase-like lactoylglutathione lyase family enzyme
MVQLRSGATILPVNDLEAAVDRYRRLGFEVERYADGGYAFWNRGNVWFHLSEGAIDPATSTTMAYLYVDDPEALHDEWQGVEGRHVAPEVKEWGVREGAYVDPDGNLLRYGVRLEG